MQRSEGRESRNPDGLIFNRIRVQSRYRYVIVPAPSSRDRKRYMVHTWYGIHVRRIFPHRASVLYS